jgi:hypothetical protein
VDRFPTDEEVFRPRQSGLFISTAAGAVAAVVGAFLWMIFVQVTGYELGVVAVGIGLLIGQVMAMTAGTNEQLPPIGGMFALFGCLLGQILTDAHFFAEAVGVSTPRALAQMSDDLRVGWDVFTAYFSPIDAVFWFVACSASFRLINKAVTARVHEQTERVIAAAGPAPVVTRTSADPDSSPFFTATPAADTVAGFSPDAQPTPVTEPPTGSSHP